MELLRSERLNRGLTLKQAASRMGISWKTLQRAEAGQSVPFPATALKIAELYGLRVTDVWPVQAVGAGRTIDRDAPPPSRASASQAIGGSPGAASPERSRARTATA
jgi:transcriptional regulator with XRE-family HTH domain